MATEAAKFIAVAPSFPMAARVRVTLYVTALLSIAAFAHTEGNGTPLFVGLIVTLIAWVLVDSPYAPHLEAVLPPVAPANAGAAVVGDSVRRRFIPRIPRILINVVVLAAAFYLWQEVRLLIETGKEGIIVALAHFIEVLLLCKFFDSKSPRDCVQILILSLLLIISATMFSGSGLFFFLILTAYIVSVFYAIVLLNLSAETGFLARAGPLPAILPGNGGERGVGGRPTPLGLLRRDLREAVRQCLFLVVPVAVVLFLLLPRHQRDPFLSMWGMGSYQTGFSEMVQLRDFGRLQPSDDEVMRVTLRRGDEDVSSEFNDLYFRGQVLDQYSDRGIWSHSPFSGATATSTAPREDGPATSEDPMPVSPRIQVTYDLQFPRGGRLMVLGPCRSPADKEYDYSQDDMTCRLISSATRGIGRIKYTLEWARDLAPLVPGRPGCTPGVLASVSVTRPDGTIEEQPTVMVSPQIDALAHDLIKNVVPTGRPIDPGEIRSVMTTFENYLRSNYAYSMTFLRVDTSLERTTDFLLNRKATGGNCEYFASAMVMMCRAVGLNARMVSGYHGGEYYPATRLGVGYFLVRQKYAHTWAEVYVAGQGWVLSDPTPSGATVDGSELTGNWFRDLTRIVQGTWLTSVVSFDNDSRAALAGWFSVRYNALLEWQSFSSRGFTLALWGTLLALIVVLVLLHRRFRRLRPLLAATRGLPHRQARLTAHVPFLDDLLGLFDDAATRRPDLTPLEFLQPHLPRLAPAAAEQARWLVVTAYGVRFGGLHIEAELKHEIALALRGVKAAVRVRPRA
jgi:protein-glutamine gamma-glutamyltransferase